MSRTWLLIIIASAAILLGNEGCDSATRAPQSASGVQKASVKIQTDSSGLTVEQKNIRDRLLMDNQPGSIKHLYIISAYSGQVLLYSTVRGKVTSGGKRLTPTSVVVGSSGDWKRDGFDVHVNGSRLVTSEVLQDDGTYGHSMDYLYWFDSRGIYHQAYPTGGVYIHISNEPIAVKSVVLNLELKTHEQEGQ